MSIDQNLIHGVPINQMQINKEINGNVFMVKDTNLYSHYFLQSLFQLNKSFFSLILINDTLYYINNNKIEYSEPLPTDLPLNKVVEFRADKEMGNYIIKLKRMNNTDIDYEVIIDNSSVKKGLCRLNGSFFFAADPEEDPKSESMIMTRRYLDTANHFSQIRVEIGKASRVVLYMTVKNICLDRIVFREQ